MQGQSQSQSASNLPQPGPGYTAVLWLSLSSLTIYHQHLTGQLKPACLIIHYMKRDIINLRPRRENKLLTDDLTSPKLHRPQKDPHSLNIFSSRKLQLAIVRTTTGLPRTLSFDRQVKDENTLFCIRPTQFRQNSTSRIITSYLK